VAALAMPSLVRAAPAGQTEQVATWYRLMLQLVRHTPTYSPPVAARTLGVVGVGLWETVAAARGLPSLGGQLNGMSEPPRPGGLALDAAIHGAMACGLKDLFANTGPSGRQALRVVESRMGRDLAGRDPASVTAGTAIMQHVLDWAATDGGATVENLGFARTVPAAAGPADWVPTSTVRLQQAPLLPGWGDNRPMALPAVADFIAGPPHDYSEDGGSAFHAEAREVYDVSRAATAGTEVIARFWSDDPMLTFTPPGHWVSILLQLAAQDALPVERFAAAAARLGIVANDTFIACWSAKFRYNRLRPVTYIRRVLDKDWTPMLITPPFPEYTSGHSCLSGGAAEVLASTFGAERPFADETHLREGFEPRRFASLRAAAEEAAMSRLYGGIHFRNANEQGLEQGRRVGAVVNALRLA
jgi:hypothetical protein